jgi:hypothetical protein
LFVDVLRLGSAAGVFSWNDEVTDNEWITVSLIACRITGDWRPLTYPLGFAFPAGSWLVALLRLRKTFSGRF